MQQQTAVEYLIEQLQAPCRGIPSHIIEQSLQMEKKQIIDAWEDGAQSEHRAKVNDKADKNSLNYYKETFKNE